MRKSGKGQSVGLILQKLALLLGLIGLQVHPPRAAEEPLSVLYPESLLLDPNGVKRRVPPTSCNPR
jgi:hypothetical protein